MNIEKSEIQPNGQIKVWIRFTGLRPLFIGIGETQTEATLNAVARATGLLNSL